MKTIELTEEEVTLIRRLLTETEFGGSLAVVSTVVKISTSILEKLDSESSTL